MNQGKEYGKFCLKKEQKIKKRINGRETLEQTLQWNEKEAIYMVVSGGKGLSRLQANTQSRLSFQHSRDRVR